ncbi:MAG: hypothetical protein ACM3MI_05705, partial [Clostridiales bacterium]
MIVFLIISSGYLTAADILLLYSSYSSNSSIRQLEVSCSFYGLELYKFEVENGYFTEDSLSNLISSEGVGAVVICADLLDILALQNTFLNRLEKANLSVPVLIADITSETDEQMLELWSNGAVTGCASSGSGFSEKRNLNPAARYVYIARDAKLTAQLGGYYLPFNTSEVYQLRLNGKYKSQSLIKLSSSSSAQSMFVRIKKIEDKGEFFFLSRFDSEDSEDITSWRFRHNNFYQFAPWMFFLTYSCKDRCMLVQDHFANLTIDDPWLTDPYGYFSFSGLLKEMQKSNFHTTIGFIPWNYDRSKKDVIDLISKNPDRFSICMHGNNHDYKEFNEYERDFGDFARQISTKDMEFNIEQALARMEKFSELTGLTYEKVMIFPHRIAPLRALELLKKYNFIATANSINVPPDSVPFLDPVIKLRSVNTTYENFPNFERYRVDEVTSADVAIDLFLGNPILFYARHDFFMSGIDNFNKIARKINRMQPDIKWLSLGEIAKRFYLKKRSSAEGSTYIYAFGNQLTVENKTRQTIAVNLVMKENDLKSISRITLDNNSFGFLVSKTNDQIIIPFELDPKHVRQLSVEYKNNFDKNKINIEKDEWDINVIRELSDFRDMNLSKNFFGQILTAIYNRSGLYLLGVKRGIVVLLVLFSIFVVGFRYMMILIRRAFIHEEIPVEKKTQRISI